MICPHITFFMNFSPPRKSIHIIFIFSVTTEFDVSISSQIRRVFAFQTGIKISLISLVQKHAPYYKASLTFLSKLGVTLYMKFVPYGFKIENESKDLFRETKNPQTEKMTLEK